MSRTLQGLRFLALLLATFLCVRSLSQAFAATRDPGVLALSEISASVSWPAPDPDALLRLVLAQFGLACLFGGSALFFARTIREGSAPSRQVTLANALGVALFGCAGVLFLEWSLGRALLDLNGRESPYAVLVRAEEFAGTAVGIGGEEPPTSRAFKDLASRPQATPAFLQLIAFGTPAAQVYGLCGLRHSAPVLYTFVSRPFRHSSREVRTFFGCILDRSSMGDLIYAKNGLRLEPGENLAEWSRRFRAGRPQGDLGPLPELDVEGGGYTSMFLDDDRPGSGYTVKDAP